MSSNILALGEVENIYVARFGEGGKWSESSLSQGLLRFNWDHLTFEEVSSAPREAIRSRLLSTASSPGEATNDSGRLDTLRSSRSGDLWVAFANNEMWWTRLVDGPVERDETSTFRRTTGWSNRSLTGNTLGFAQLNERVRTVNQTSPSAVNPVRDEYNRRAVLADIQGVDAPAVTAATPKATVQVDGQQREALRNLWNKLRHLGWVGDIGDAGHGLQACLGPGKARWFASMYWSNSSSGNPVSFCIHAGRLFVGDDERGKFKKWLSGQRALLGGRDAEVRSHEKQVQDADRVGFDYEEGVEFLRRFVAALDPLRPDRATRWQLPLSIDSPSGPEPMGSDVIDGEADADVEVLPGVETETLDPLAMSIKAMVSNADGAAAESGKVRERIAKLKEVRMSEAELAVHIRELIEGQGLRCNLTQLPLHFKTASEGEVDTELMASLDRIRSDGHYERGNLQVVCWFVNRWKGDDTHDNFARLLQLIAAPRDSTSASLTEGSE